MTTISTVNVRSVADGLPTAYVDVIVFLDNGESMAGYVEDDPARRWVDDEGTPFSDRDHRVVAWAEFPALPKHLKEGPGAKQDIAATLAGCNDVARDGTPPPESFLTENLIHSREGDGALFTIWNNLAVARLKGYSIQPLEDVDAAPLPFSFQEQVRDWMLECFGHGDATEPRERMHRFVEEALELAQACGCKVDEAHALVNYVFSRPIGEVHQEVGGVMVTLGALCWARRVSMEQSGWDELARCHRNMVKIRAKHAAKPRGSALPGTAA